MPEEGAAEAAHQGTYWGPVFWGIVVFAIILLVFGTAIQRHKHERIPRNLFFRIAEHIYLFIEQMCLGVIGPHGRKYIPLVGTIFMFILFSNYIGLFGLPSPTATLGVNLGMSIIVFCYVQFEGIRVNGILGYVRHFMGPMLAIAPLMFVVEVVSEFAKIISLSLRLYGNIYGEHEVSHIFSTLWEVWGVPIPLQAPILLLAILTSTIQALVFTILTAIYLSLMTAHGPEAHEPAEAGAH